MLYTAKYMTEGKKLGSCMIVRDSEKAVLEYIKSKGWTLESVHLCPYPFIAEERKEVLSVIKKDEKSEKKIVELESKIAELNKKLEEKASDIQETGFDFNMFIDSLDGRRSYRPSELKKMILGEENV